MSLCVLFCLYLSISLYVCMRAYWIVSNILQTNIMRVNLLYLLLLLLLLLSLLL